MNNEHAEDNNQNDPSDLGSDPDVPVLQIPPPEHTHHPAIEAQHRRYYIKRSIEFVQERWPRASTWSAIGSLITAVATIVMVVVYIQIKGIMSSQGGQTEKLITAADTQAFAAKNFAASAAGINAGIGTAVDKLNLQADKLQASVEQATRVAHATNDLARQAGRSADIAANDQRPWVGVAGFQCEGCAVDPDGALTLERLALILTNTGKTPAVQLLKTKEMYDDILGNPTPTLASIEANAADLRARDEELQALITPEARNLELHMGGPLPEVLAPNAPTPWVLQARARFGRDMKVPFAKRKIVYFLGKVTYSDTARLGQYVTTFCLMSSWSRSDAGFRFCDKGNDMK